MFTFYHKDPDKFTKWVKDQLEEMVVAHKIINVNETDSHALPDGISGDDLPMLSDGHECWTSRQDIKTFLEELHGDLQFSRSLSSDAC